MGGIPHALGLQCLQVCDSKVDKGVCSYAGKLDEGLSCIHSC